MRELQRREWQTGNEGCEHVRKESEDSSRCV